MKDTTLDPGVQSVIDDINNGKMTTTYQAEGKPALLFDTNTVYSDEKGEQWRKENDYGGTLWDRASSKIMDIYRNMFSDDAMKMKDAKQYGDELGISSQFLMDNEDALEEARRIHDEAIQWSFLSGQPFNAENIDTMYPEIKKMREADSVGASIALQNYHDLKETRNIFKPVIDFASYTGQLFSDAAASGADMVRLYDAQMKAVESGDIEGNRPYIEELANKLNEEEKAKPDDFAGEVVYEAIKQLTIYGTQGIRALQYVPKSMALAMTAAAPAALAAGASSLGIGAAAVETGAGLTGAAWGLRTGMFKEITKQSMADRYWELAQRKDENGNPLYSRGQMLADSSVVGGINGAVELGLLEFGYAPIKAAWGNKAAQSILKNGAAQKQIVDAGKLALARMAAWGATKQYARSVGSELIEEGVQQTVNDVADNLEYAIQGQQGKYHTAKDVLNDAVDAMVQAVPAAIGIGGMGAAAHGIGHYNGMSAIASMKVNDWREAYQRQVEEQTMEALVKQKEKNNLAKENPEVYGKVIQAQAEKNDMGTIYVDAQELSRTDEGIAVLNDAVQRGMVTEDQVEQAVKNGTDIELPTGIFAQLSDESFDTKTLMDASTMNKGGIHRAALRQRAERMEALRKELRDIANDTSDSVSEEIMQEHFADTDEETQELARDVVYRNPYDLESAYKEAVKDTREQLEDILGFNAYWNYKPQGVAKVVVDQGTHTNVQTGRGLRMSNNEKWWSDMYSDLGRKATKEEMLYIAYKDQKNEVEHYASPEDAAKWNQETGELLRRYERLRDMEQTFHELAQGDYALRKSFQTKEGAAVYKQTAQTLSTAGQKASKAARENAYIYARMAERWADIRHEYGDTAYTAQDFAKAHPIVMNQQAGQFGQAMYNVRKSGTNTFDEFIKKINDRRQKGKPANKLMFIGNSGVIYAEAQVVHATTPHHGHVLNAGQLDDIDAHIGTLQNAAISNKKDTAVFSGIPVLTHVKGKLGDYYVVLEIDDKGTTWFKTGFPGKAESIENIIKTKIAEHSARILSHNAQGPSSQNKTAISLSSIQKELSNVNEKYKQAGHDNQAYRQGQLQAAYDSHTGAIHLFDAADQSSFVHEAAHMWLSEMEAMAQKDGAPVQLITDLQTIRDWAGYAPERLDDYKGTKLEKEFAGHAEAIENARKSGDDVAIKAAEERWMQERFARGFERYIAEGKAPTKELTGIFRRFKKWLIGIYQDLKNLGKEPPADVKRVMNRMLATDKDIELWAKTRELNAWDRKGFSGDLTGPEGEMIRKWSEEVKERSKERLLQEFIASEQNNWKTLREESLKKERLDYEKQVCDENEIYRIENIYNHMPESRSIILEKNGYKNEAAFRQALHDAGGTLEERSATYMEERKKLYDDMMPTYEDICKEADKQLASTNGQARLNDLERAAMQRKINAYIAECVRAMQELGRIKGSDEEVRAQLRQIMGIADQEDKARVAKGRMDNILLSRNEEIRELKKSLAAERKKDKLTKEENETQIKSLKKALREVIHGLNQVRDMPSASYVKMLELSRQELEDMKVSEATTWRHFEIKAKAASHLADQHMSAGNFEQALLEKGNAQKFYCMARAAKDNEEYVRKALEGQKGTLDNQGDERYGIKGILNRISRAKNPVRMGMHSRYFLQHLAYNLGITDRDGRPPTQDGKIIGLDWNYIYRDLSPDYCLAEDSNGKIDKPNESSIVAPWIRNIVDGKERMKYQDLSLAQFRDIDQAITALYKSGRREYEATTILDEEGKQVSIPDAVEQLSQSMKQDLAWNPQQTLNNQNRKGRLKEKASDAILSLTKIEVILEDMGPKWMQYIWNPIDRADRKEITMQQEAVRTFAKICHIYSPKEWQHIRNDKAWAVGATTNFTHEQILAMALNWGNKEGRQRIMDYHHVNEADMEDLFTRALTKKDLDFLEAVWDSLKQYWPERNAVQERLYGVGLGQVQPMPFTINGRKISGGYYPIRYDPKLSVKASEHEMDDIVKTQLSGSSTMAIGMGSTKKRAKTVQGMGLDLSLDVWPAAINEAIHHICMREAVTDVYKIISHPDIQKIIQENYGMHTYDAIKQWTKDCWKTDVQKMTALSRTLERLRRKTSYAVMAFRTSTAVLNALNIFPMMNRIGAINTIRALGEFGAGILGGGTKIYHQNRQFVMQNSPMMADRINTIDRDLQQGMAFQVQKGSSRLSVKLQQKRDSIGRYGYWFITETDLMCSMALWRYAYNQSLREQVQAQKTDPGIIKDQAVLAADKAVRDIFGSGRVKDQPAMMRQNDIIAQLAPFYSYSNTVLNAMIKGGYQWKKGNRIALFNAMLWWVILPTVFETVYREAVAGDDDPEKILKKMGIKLVSNTAQGIPVVRDTLEDAMYVMLGLPSFQNSNLLGLSMGEEAIKALQAGFSPNKDWTDVGRSTSRAVNRYYGFSDTLTDGFWALMRFSMVDTDRSVSTLLNSIIFDRRYKTLKERQREERKKEKEAKK
ncbi:hypothetical protein ACG98G_10380 [Megasphaera hexanoica]|uniref:Barnase-EndoU-ColicinE5/D-RelE like domain-containing protein n=1 Tax=Megasphaera hexanoica TaxID=1675036 RepID=A0ABW7DRN1_9FIRM|nr:hypothetical protein [Megasphaera hexanoica]AXB81148.1 hypothetical protein ACT01_02240 [Megasphaera hexanoica]